jgi:hypothetical protein
MDFGELVYEELEWITWFFVARIVLWLVNFRASYEQFS